MCSLRGVPGCMWAPLYSQRQAGLSGLALPLTLSSGFSTPATLNWIGGEIMAGLISSKDIFSWSFCMSDGEK